MRRTSRLIQFTIWAAALSLPGPAARAAPIFVDNFDGPATALDGAAPDVRPGVEVWSANAPFRADGSIDANVEGSAILSFQPLVNHRYTLSLDVANTTDRWVALGFARDALAAPGTDNVNDRFSNEAEGISWMLFRDHLTDPTQDIQLFGGLRTAGGIADTNPAINFAQANNLKILIDTTGDGTSFTADFLLNNTSLLASGPATIALPLDDINFVGLSFDDATTATTIAVDNFSLDGVEVPEPATLLLLALVPIAISRRRGR